MRRRTNSFTTVTVKCGGWAEDDNTVETNSCSALGCGPSASNDLKRRLTVIGSVLRTGAKFVNQYPPDQQVVKAAYPFTLSSMRTRRSWYGSMVKSRTLAGGRLVFQRYDFVPTSVEFNICPLIVSTSEPLEEVPIMSTEPWSVYAEVNASIALLSCF